MFGGRNDVSVVMVCVVVCDFLMEGLCQGDWLRLPIASANGKLATFTTNFWSPQRQQRKLRTNYRAQEVYMLEMV